MKNLIIAVVLSSSVCIAQSAFAGGDAEAGATMAVTCAACHGEGGNSTQAANPKLAGQYESYLIHALKSYRSGSRANPIMNAMAGALKDQDIADLAAYFSSQQEAVSVLKK